MPTLRLYYQDSYLRQFQARVIGRSPDGRKLCLDQTAFYPTGGGQPHDLGWIDDVPVLEVSEEEGEIWHLTERPVAAETVTGSIDWPRRFDHMQQHTGQHLLSAVFFRTFGWQTIGFHLGTEVSTIDLDVSEVRPDQLDRVECQAYDLVFQNLPVKISFEHSSDAQDLRRESQREGILRVVTIEGLDRSPCGGTHVKSTAEIGPIAIRKVDKVRGCVRLEFLCGLRAVRRSRQDFQALTRIGNVLSCSLDEAPKLVELQRQRLLETDKRLRKLQLELAQLQGRQLYSSTEPDAQGIRRYLHFHSGELDESVRGIAQGFTAGARALFAAFSSSPPSVLLAASDDLNLDCGQILRELLLPLGGRGGGKSGMAQGSLPTPESVQLLAEKIRAIC